MIFAVWETGTRPWTERLLVHRDTVHTLAIHGLPCTPLQCYTHTPCHHTHIHTHCTLHTASCPPYPPLNPSPTCPSTASPTCSTSSSNHLRPSMPSPCPSSPPPPFPPTRPSLLPSTASSLPSPRPTAPTTSTRYPPYCAPTRAWARSRSTASRAVQSKPSFKPATTTRRLSCTP